MQAGGSWKSTGMLSANDWKTAGRQLENSETQPANKWKTFEDSWKTIGTQLTDDYKPGEDNWTEQVLTVEHCVRVGLQVGGAGRRGNANVAKPAHCIQLTMTSLQHQQTLVEQHAYNHQYTVQPVHISFSSMPYWPM